MYRKVPLEALRVDHRRSHGFGRERCLANGPTGLRERREFLYKIRNVLSNGDFERFVSLCKANAKLFLSVKKQVGELILYKYWEHGFTCGNISDIRIILSLSRALSKLLKVFPDLKNNYLFGIGMAAEEELKMAKAIGERNLADFYVLIDPKDPNTTREDVTTGLKRAYGIKLEGLKLPEKVDKSTYVKNGCRSVTITMMDFTSVIGRIDWVGGPQPALMYEVRVSEQ